MIERLPRVIEETDKSGIGGPDHPMRVVTRAIAFEDGGWTEDRSAKVKALFDGLAESWKDRDRPGRLDPLRDALARGLPAGAPRGLCLELGSGTGFATPLLCEAFEHTLAVDLSIEMLRRADPELGRRVRGDGAALPVPDASVDALVLMNAFLFPEEVERVLSPMGCVVWVCSSGDETPIYLSAEDVDRALGQAWRGTASEAGGGTWSVHFRGKG